MFQHSSRIRIVALIGALALQVTTLQADDFVDLDTDVNPIISHQHGAWSIVVNPVVAGWIKPEIGDPTDALIEYGASAFVSRRLSRSAMLDFGLLMTRASHNGKTTSSYLLTLVPKLIVSKSQRDRFFAGLGGAILALDEPGEHTHWGYGPQVTLGVDLEVSRATCLYVASDFGITGFGKRKVYSNPTPRDARLTENAAESDRSTGWARLVLGVRLSI